MPQLSTRIRQVMTTDDLLTLQLEDGRVLSVPTVWFPRLDGASTHARAQWELFDDATAVHWPDLDEDISAAGLLGVPD